MTLHDMAKLPNVGKHLVLSQYAVDPTDQILEIGQKPLFLALWII